MPSTATLTATEYNSSGAVIPAPVLAWASLGTGVFTVPSAGSGGQTAVVTATGVGTADGTCTDPTTTVTGQFTVNVATSLGIVVVPVSAYLSAVLGALANGGSGVAGVSVKMRFLVNSLINTPTSGPISLLRIADAIDVYAAATGSTYEVVGSIGPGGESSGVITAAALSSLPASGSYVVLYSYYDSAGPSTNGAGGVSLFTDAGTVLVTQAYSGGGTPIGEGNTDGTGDIAFAYNAAASGPYLQGLSIDGLAVYVSTTGSAQLSGAARYSPPQPLDANLQQLSGFAGVLTPTSGVGATLAVTGGSVTYLSGGIWN